MVGRAAVGGIGALACSMLVAAAAHAAPFTFATGAPDGKVAFASQPAPEIAAADDFVLTTATSLRAIAFTGLTSTAATPARVRVAFHAVFPDASDTSRTPTVPTRVNSPSDTAVATRDSAEGGLGFSSTVLAPTFTANNSVRTGIHPKPNQTTGGEGAVSGQELSVTATFATPVTLGAGHYFVSAQVGLPSGQFYWLSSPRPIPAGPFPAGSSDLQAWIRDAALDPDWLRVGTDIIGGATPPTDDASFTLTGATCGAIGVAPDALAPGVAGQPYDTTLSASGGTAPYAFAAAGSLPPGVALAPSGRLSGTPQQAGGFSFTVTATDASGCQGSRAYTLAVDAPPGSASPAPTAAPAPAATATAPRITRARISPRRFRAATGATIAYTDSGPAVTTLTFARLTTGHRAGRRCRAGRPRRGARACVLASGRGSFTHRDAGGAVRLRFHGRVGGRRLAPGRYRLRLTPSSTAGTGRPASLTFTVLPPRRRA